jgi:hypothetical protein
VNLAQEAEKIYTYINGKKTKLGDLQKITKVIKGDHSLAMELCSTGFSEWKLQNEINIQQASFPNS